MKKVILLGDGMGDYPVPALGDRTPLQAADMPAVRALAAAGQVRMIQTVPEGLPPGSDVANLSLMGYNPAAHYTGRAPIEAAGAGLSLDDRQVAFRCNLVTIENDRMADYSAGHISTEEATELIAACEKELGREGLRFHTGISYRHLLLWTDGPDNAITQPPHDIADRDIDAYLPDGERGGDVRKLMDASVDIFSDHPVNRKRIAEGKASATQIWLWGQGRSLSLPSFQSLYGLGGHVISAVDLIRGLGRLSGLEPILVEGATGFLDTNYEGKAAAALEALEKEDFVYVHIEAPDECGHLGDEQKKIQAIEDYDRRIVQPVWEGLEKAGRPYRLLIAMDHRTPVSVKGHTRDAVPVLEIEGPTGALNGSAPFDEFASEAPAIPAHEFVAQWLKRD